MDILPRVMRFDYALFHSRLLCVNCTQFLEPERLAFVRKIELQPWLSPLLLHAGTCMLLP